MPWLLKSEVQHLLVLLAFGIWFGMEVNEGGSLIRLHDESQVLAYALLGLVYVGFGYVLRRGPFASFANVTERLGLLDLPLAGEDRRADRSRSFPGNRCSRRRVSRRYR